LKIDLRQNSDVDQELLKVGECADGLGSLVAQFEDKNPDPELTSIGQVEG
jgi:hypothetical protein